jgi:hypothetical protein
MVYRMIYPVQSSEKIRDAKDDTGPKSLFWSLVVKRKEKRNKGYPGKKKEVCCWKA